jgi:hypothetical protein
MLAAPCISFNLTIRSPTLFLKLLDALPATPNIDTDTLPDYGTHNIPNPAQPGEGQPHNQIL